MWGSFLKTPTSPHPLPHLFIIDTLFVLIMNHFPHLLLVPSVLNKPHLSVTSLADYSDFIVRIHDQVFKFVSASSAPKHTEVSLGNDTKDQTSDKKSASSRLIKLCSKGLATRIKMTS